LPKRSATTTTVVCRESPERQTPAEHRLVTGFSNPNHYFDALDTFGHPPHAGDSTMATFTASLANDHDPSYVVDAAETLDSELAYDNFFIGDERLNRNTHALLALAAANTDDIGLGTGVTNPYTRHPAITAAAMATLDKASDGRAHLGLGGGSPIVLDPLGYDQDDPIGTVRDAVKMIRGLLDGEEMTVERKEFEIHDAGLDVTPDNDVPIYVAGRGPHLLGLGGFRGDGVIAGAGVATVEGMEYAMEKIAEGAEKADRDVADIDVVCWAFLSIADDRETALDGVNPLVSRIVNKTPMPALEAIGVDPADAKQVKDLEDVRGMDADELREHVPREVTEQFAIAGTPAECRAHVDRLHEFGVDHIGLLSFDNDANDELENLETFSEAVIGET
jgi:5,10-methylenetetrahydromethanopterin reductase